MPHFTIRAASLKDIGTSRILPVPVFFTFRTVGVGWTFVTVALGLYTRRGVFFLQFTNWMMLVSLAYMICSWLVTYRYIRLKVYNPREDIEFFKELRPSRLATITWILMEVAWSAEVIVTSVFWLLILDEFDTKYGLIDWVYGVSSHGVVFLCLTLELLITKVRFVSQHHWALQATIAIYVCVALICFYGFGYPVYFFCDLSVPLHRLIVIIIFILGGIVFEIGRIFCLVRDYAYVLCGVNVIPPIVRHHKTLERLPVEYARPRIVTEVSMPETRPRAVSCSKHVRHM